MYIADRLSFVCHSPLNSIGIGAWLWLCSCLEHSSTSPCRPFGITLQTICFLPFFFFFCVGCYHQVMPQKKTTTLINLLNWLFNRDFCKSWLQYPPITGQLFIPYINPKTPSSILFRWVLLRYEWHELDQVTELTQIKAHEEHSS